MMMTTTTVVANGMAETAAVNQAINTNTRTATRRQVANAWIPSFPPKLPPHLQLPSPRTVKASVAILTMSAMATAMTTTTTADASTTEVIAVGKMARNGNIRTARNANVRIQRPQRQKRHQKRRKASVVASVHNPNTKKMVVVTTITTTVAAVGTAGIAVVHLATKTNLFTARNASVLIQSMITVAAPAHVVRPHGSAMETAMTTITTADANTMGAIAVVSVVPSTNTPTVRSASAKTNRTSPKLIAGANVVYLITLATVDAMTKTTIVHVDGIKVTAAEALATSINFRTVRSVTARTPKLKRKGAAPVNNNAGWPLMWAMVVVTITTTTAAVVGTKETAVEVVATRGNSYTAANVNAQTPLSRRAIAPANVEIPSTNLTVVVTMTTTIVAVAGTAVTVAAQVATSDNGFIAASASVRIRNSRRPTSAQATKEVVCMLHGLATVDAMTRTTTARAIGIKAIAAGKVATSVSTSTVPSANAWTQPRRRPDVQRAVTAVPRVSSATSDATMKTITAAATGTVATVVE